MSHHSRSSISCELNFHHDEPNDTDTDTLTLTLTDPDPDTDDHDSEFIRESIFDGLFDTRYGIEHDIYEEPQLGNNDIPGDIEQGIDEPQLGNNQVGEMELDIEDEEAMNPSVEATIPGHFNIILEPQDIDSRPEVADYPGNISLQRIVQPFLLRYGRATRVNERNSIVFAIHALVVSPTNRPSSRFLVPGSTSGVNIYCREATLEEIVAKIEEVIRSHFNMVPTPNDVLFGRGQPIRDHPGNRLLRDFIDHRRHQYFISNNIERQAMIQLTRDIITSVGGRFLLPYNGTPFNGLNGCIPADEPSIRKKIRDLYREKRNEDDILIAKPRPPDEDPPLIMAHHLPTALPTSMMSSTPLPIDDFKDQETIQKEIPPHFNLTFSPSDVFIGSGQSIQDYPGNRTLQDFIDHRRLKYFVSNQNERHDMIQLTRDTIKRAGGRFLFLYHGKPFTGLCGCILADEQSIQKTIQDLYCRKTNDDGYPEEDLPGLMDHHVSTTLPTSITSSSPSSITYTDDQETVQTETEISPPVVNINHGSSVSTISGIVPEASEEASTIGNSLHLRRCTMVNIHHVSSVSTISGVVSEASKQAGTVDNPFHLRRDTCAKIFLGSVAIVVLLAVAVAFTSSQQETSHFLPLDEKSLTLRSILKRERLTCGIINQERYSAQDLSIAPWTGFEVDLCRAVGAGIFGKEKFAPLASRSSEPVEYRILEARERFVALDNLTVDLLLADTPQTMERNVYEPSTKKGYTFSVPYLDSSLRFAGYSNYIGCFASLNSTSQWNTTDYGHCQNTKICVQNGTNHEDIIRTRFPDLNEDNFSIRNTRDDFYKYFISGRCDLLAADQLDLVQSNFKKRGFIVPYNMETQILSNQAISMATRDGDVIFSAFCNLVVLGLFAAEEKRLVSSSEVSPLDFEHVHIFGKRYKTMLKDMVEVVGDYGQIYEKYIESLVPRSKSQPRVKTIDFGNTKTDQLSQMTSIKIQEIKERGHLNCGFSNKFRFRAEKEQFNRTGVEVDFCKSISAAIFGPMGNVTYEPLHDFNSFNALKTGRIDVLARATTSTTEQDLMERATTQVGFSFSYPIFYDKTFYAGEPEFVKCAEKHHVNVGTCSELSLCVTSGTSQHEVLSRIFSNDMLILSDSMYENIESLRKGRCKVLAGGKVEVSNASTQKWFGRDDFIIGSEPLSEESLSLITADDDPLWFKLVHWVASAPIYAEEQKISQDTFFDMPQVDLFQPMISNDLMRNVIQTVGSYGEILARNAA